MSKELFVHAITTETLLEQATELGIPVCPVLVGQHEMCFSSAVTKRRPFEQLIVLAMDVFHQKHAHTVTLRQEERLLEERKRA